MAFLFTAEHNDPLLWQALESPSLIGTLQGDAEGPMLGWSHAGSRTPCELTSAGTKPQGLGTLRLCSCPLGTGCCPPPPFFPREEGLAAFLAQKLLQHVAAGGGGVVCCSAIWPVSPSFTF